MNNNLDQVKTAFISHLKDIGRATATIIAYQNDVGQLIDYLKVAGVTQLSEISTPHIENFKNDLLKKGYTTKSVARKINSTKTFFRYLIEEKLLESNPSEGVSQPKYLLTPPRILTKMEYRSLRDVSRHDTRMYAIIELFLQTGIRIGELTNLLVDDVKDGKLYIRPYESHPGRVIPLNKPALKAVEEWLKIRPESGDMNLFITKTGRTFQVRNVRTAIDRYFRLADIKNATVNDLRHTFIAHQLKAGTPLVLVSKLAGHKRLSTTEKYLDFIQGKKSSESMRLEEL